MSIVVLVVPVAAALLLRPYGDFLVAIGGRLIHATDIADIPDLFFAGFFVFGGLLLFAAIGVVYARRGRAGA